MEGTLAEVIILNSWIEPENMKSGRPILRSDIIDWLRETNIKVTVSFKSLREGPVDGIPVDDYSGIMWECAVNDRLVFDTPDDAVLFKLTWR